FATELSAAAIMEGIRQGKTVVKLESPADPMAELVSDVAPEKDTIHAKKAHLTATITGGKGYTARWVKNGAEEPQVDVTADPFVIETDVEAPATGEDRWRVEVLKTERRRTVTSNVYITLSGASGTGGSGAKQESDDRANAGGGAAEVLG